jgi:ABC-type nitrate/sulfonate/bicarbonate transport system permease component
MELVAARDGLGVLVGQYGNTFNMAGVYAILITLAIAGALLNALMAAAERRVSGWQRAQASGATLVG